MQTNTHVTNRPVNRSLLVLAAIGWTGVGASGLWEIAWEDAGDNWQRPYAFYAVALLVGASAIVSTAWIGTRHAQPVMLRRVAQLVCALGVLSAVVAWAIPLWMTLLAVGIALMALVADQPLRRGLAIVAAAQLLGMSAMFIAAGIGVGHQDSYGDYPDAFGIGLVTTAVVVLIGTLDLARSDASWRAESTEKTAPESSVVV